MELRFPGSVFITDEILPKNRTYTPKPLNVPLFMNKRVQVRKNYEPHRQYIEKNQKLYECDKCVANNDCIDKNETNVPGENLVKCIKPLPKLGRSKLEGEPWQQAPNRYNIKEKFCTKSCANNGHWSTLERIPETLPGRFAPTKFFREHKFYDIPCGMANWADVCNKHKGKLLGDARHRRPYLRFMINDLALCWHDPNLPGPGQYNLQTHTINYKFSKRCKPRKLIIFKYLPNSIVPDPDLDIYKDIGKNLNAPGPGRFDPSIVACPCFCAKKKIYDPLIWTIIEREKRNKYRRLPYKKIRPEIYCPHPNIRNIKGQGFTWIFKSKLTRITRTAKTESTSKLDRDEKMQHTAKYMQMLVNPSRLEISKRFGDEILKPIPRKVVFNSIYKPVIRKKLRTNKRIAFMSGTPRFPNEDVLPKPTKSKNKKPKVKKPKPPKSDVKPEKKHSVRRSISFLGAQELFSYAFLTQQAIAERLSRIPKRFNVKRVNTRERTFAFSPLPPAKLLIKDDDIGKFDSFELPLYLKESKPEDYFKDEYCEHFVIKIKKDSFGPRHFSNPFYMNQLNY